MMRIADIIEEIASGLFWGACIIALMTLIF